MTEGLAKPRPTQPTPAEIVFSANDRCPQENLIAHRKAVRALHSPVDNLTFNGASLRMTGLAWNLKACGFPKRRAGG